ncbi:WAT1-related protein At1g43650 [Syzygium oleosum]|uniref:WAT1-related protein At1g43650 n=1 Tax=Syzygium oleosum TaxID=219896 RepID=UPI0024BA0FC7|nr:WAT1-related protein At1g43650 [Syzygium oleosum]
MSLGLQSPHIYRYTLASSKLEKMGSHKPYIAMVSVQCVYAGMALFSKAAIAKGMNPFVFVVFRQALAFIAISPFAFFLERKESATLTYGLLFKIFLVAFFGLTLSLNLYCVAINYTSATFAAATTNTIPAITLIMAVFLRMEGISVGKWHGRAKVVGSVMGVSGALVYAFVKGPPVNLINWSSSGHARQSPPSGSTGIGNHSSSREWIKGSLIMLSANTLWSLWLILQGPIIKQYPAKLRLTTLQCFFSCMQSAFWAIATERDPTAWKLGWDMQLLSVVYCGVIVTAISYWLQVWAIEKKGPVFTAMFTPIALVIAAFFSAFLWKETLFCGSLVGAMLMVGGLYFVLWGKIKEDGNSKEAKDDPRPETKEEATSDCMAV